MTTSIKSFRVDCSYCEIRNTISDVISQLSRSYFSLMTIDLNEDYSADNPYGEITNGGS